MNHYNVLQLGHSLLSYEAWEPLSAWVESLSIAAAMKYAIKRIPFPFPAPAHPPITLSLFSRHCGMRPYGNTAAPGLGKIHVIRVTFGKEQVCVTRRVPKDRGEF